MIRQCAICQTAFDCRGARAKREVVTCSRSCARKSQMQRLMAEGRWVRPNKQRRGTLIQCAICGKDFYANQSEQARGNRRYCSTQCAYAAQRKTPVLKACPGCGVTVKRKPSQACLIYCSQACYVATKTVKTTYLSRSHNGRPVKRDADGYLWIWEPEHPKAHCGYVFEHRWVVEQILGRYLETHEHVHHINENKEDNQPENLQVLNARDHSRITSLSNGRKFAAMREELERYRKLYGELPG